MTTAVTRSRKLQGLLDRLEGLKKRATVEQLRAWLDQADITLDDVRPCVRFSEQQYLRNLVHEGRHYHVLVLCWRSGQRSPIHNHAGSTCGMRVLQGAATETIFKFAPCRLVRPLNSHEIPESCIIVSQDADTHQVSNLQARGQDLITLHIYSPPLLRMESYSLTDPQVGEWRPMVLTHLDGSGI